MQRNATFYYRRRIPLEIQRSTVISESLESMLTASGTRMQKRH